MAQRSGVRVGDLAPDFELPDQSGTPVRLGDLVGQRPVVLYFYPKDKTPGCTIEARAFRDSYGAFTDAGAEVLGVSSDSVASHRRFVASEGLPFRLLADRGGGVRGLYGGGQPPRILPGPGTSAIARNGVTRLPSASRLPVTLHSRARR